jgi:hypothetical protein
MSCFKSTMILVLCLVVTVSGSTINLGDAYGSVDLVSSSAGVMQQGTTCQLKRGSNGLLTRNSDTCNINPGEYFVVRDTLNQVSSFLKLYIQNCFLQCIHSFEGAPAKYLRHRIEVCLNYNGGSFCITILETELPNSSVQPGLDYKVNFCIAPKDSLGGQEVRFGSCIYLEASTVPEFCDVVDCNIN